MSSSLRFSGAAVVDQCNQLGQKSAMARRASLAMQFEASRNELAVGNRVPRGKLQILTDLFFAREEMSSTLLPDSYEFQEQLGRQYQNYYACRALWILPLAGFFATVATIPYAKLSFDPVHRLPDNVSEHLKRLTIVAAGDGTFVNGIALYPKQTIDLLLRVLAFFSHLVRQQLRIPFKDYQHSQIFWSYLTVSPFFILAGPAAFFASLIFLNALDHHSGIATWVKIGMFICRAATVFASIINLLCAWLERSRMTGLGTNIRCLKDGMENFANERQNFFLSQPSSVEPDARREFKYFQARLLQTNNFVDYVAVLRHYFLTAIRFSDEAEKKDSPDPALFARIARGVLSLGIAYFATSGQWGGVMNYYKNPFYGILALTAIFSLYLDTVGETLEAIFSRKSYEARAGLIVKQIFAFGVGILSGLPSTAVFLAASDAPENNLFQGSWSLWIQLVATYLTAAMLNGRFCFKAVGTLEFFYSVFKDFFIQKDRFLAGDEGSVPEAVARGFTTFMERARTTYSSLYLTPEEIETVGAIFKEKNGRSLQLQYPFVSGLLAHQRIIPAERSPFPHAVRVMGCSSQLSGSDPSFVA